MTAKQLDQDGLEKLFNALDMLRTAIRGKNSRTELPVQLLLTFLLVSKNNGITMQEAAKVMAVEKSTVSRNVKDMDIYLVEEDGKKIQKGCGLMYRAPNEYNRREYSIFLTAKGMKLAAEINKLLK